MDGNLFSFRVEFSVRCPRCDHPVFLDGPILTAHCKSCQSDLDVPADYWIETIESSRRKMQEVGIGEATGSMLIGVFQGNLTLARFDPYCDECKTDFVDPWNLEGGSVYSCGKCGACYPVSEPPSWLSEGVSGIRLLINALLAEEGSGDDAHASGAEPVALSCPECCGLLRVDGRSRLVSCQYCEAGIYIPDGLWLRIHSGSRKRRWFVVSQFAERSE